MKDKESEETTREKETDREKKRERERWEEKVGHTRWRRSKNVIKLNISNNIADIENVNKQTSLNARSIVYKNIK